jgi:CBS domain-containing protein
VCATAPRRCSAGNGWACWRNLVCSHAEVDEEVQLDAALSEIARFLAARAPFDALGPEELGELAGQTEIEFFLAGAPILTEDGGPVTFLRVVHSGAVDIIHNDRLLDLLAVGDAFGHAAMLSGLPPGFEARAAEDTLCYRIPVAVARPLLERAAHRELQLGIHDPGHQPVARLIRAPTVTCEPMESIREVARRMTAAGAGAAIIDLRDTGFGIVTDRDIRTKIVALGVPLSAPVASVMSSPVFSVTPDRIGGEVLFELLERGFRHAPVVNERGQLIGVVEDADLFAVQPRSWFGARRSISRASTADDLVAVAERLPEVVVELHRSNLRALEVARVLSALVDALTVRVLELAAGAIQLPADGLVWVAVGSQARREMTPASTARGAVVCSEPPPPEWLESVAGTLSRCGLVGQVIARTPAEWTAAVGDDELGLTVLVERRPLWGTPREPLPVAQNGARERVLAALARRALAYSPPTGFDADAVLASDGTRQAELDIRRAAVIPIVELARWAGAAGGIVEGSTPERLRAAGQSGVFSDGDARTLADAFELALDLRIGHHMERLAAGERPDDRIDPAQISPLMRDHLRDVFRAVGSVQRRLRA